LGWSSPSGEGERAARVDFYVSRELEAEKLVAVQVSGRGDTIIVDAGVWDDVLSLASRLKAAPAALTPDP